MRTGYPCFVFSGCVSGLRPDRSSASRTLQLRIRVISSRPIALCAATFHNSPRAISRFSRRFGAKLAPPRFLLLGVFAMSDRPDNKRSAPRYTLIMDALITDLLTRTTIKLRNSDISLTGCYIDALNPLERGTPVLLRLEHDSQVFECPGVVAYTVARLGMGVNFVQPL